MNTLARLLIAAVVLGTPLAAAQGPPQPGGDPTVIGQVEHEGYALVGPRGRHYVFGGIAMADYSDSAGTRRIVTLQLEDQIKDERHVHYRELREGHRWAFSKTRGSDGMYGVWIQLASADPAARPQWQSFQRARMEEPREGTAPALTMNTGLGGATCCAR